MGRLNAILATPNATPTCLAADCDRAVLLVGPRAVELTALPALLLRGFWVYVGTREMTDCCHLFSAMKSPLRLCRALATSRSADRSKILTVST